MFTKPQEKPNPEILAINERMNKIETRIEKVEGFQRECDDLHRKIEEQSKRNDDAIKNNTESNLLATKSINELSVVITESVAELNNNISQLAIQVKSHDPVVNEWKNIGTALTYNKKVLIGAGILAASITAIVTAYNLFA